MGKWLIYCLSVCTVLFLTSCQEEEGGIVVPTRKAELYVPSMYSQGSQRWEKQKDSLISANPEEEKHYRQKSIPFTLRGDYDIAIPLLEKSYETDRTENLYYYSWVTLFHYRDYEKALRLLQEYDDLTPNVRDYPMSKNINYLKGLAHRQLGHWDSAIKEFQTVVKDEAELTDEYTYVYMGICYLMKGQYRTAHEQFDRALQVADNNTMAIYYKALTFRKEGKKALSERWLLKAEDCLLRGNTNYRSHTQAFDKVYLMTILDKKEEWGLSSTLSP